MAHIDLGITIADPDYDRLMVAAKATFGLDKTDDEIIESIRQAGISLIRELVSNYERRVAIAAAEALRPTIEVS